MAILILLISMLIQYSESCPPIHFFNFSCPDNVYNGPLSTSHFTSSSREYYNCSGGPFELTCNNANRTMIKCTKSPYEDPPYRVLEINPTNLSISVDYTDGWLPPGDLKQYPCKAYLDLKAIFPNFQSVSLFINSWGENQSFLGCPYHHDYWNADKKTGCGNATVYGPYAHGRLPKGKLLPSGCMQFLEFYSPPASYNKTSSKGVLAHALEIALPSIGILGGLAIGLWYCLITKRRTSINLDVEAFLKTCGSSAPQRYTYSDIKKMTSSFKEKIGQGGFGVVYKGRLKDGCFVAVKLFNQSKVDNGEEFINEVASIGRTNHINIVTLLGFCFQCNKRALVYEFMPNGSLEKFTKSTRAVEEDQIHDGGSKSLTWKTVFEISLGITRGLEYLHRGCQTRILHFDIKPHNILLDENFCPKISDFGLAKLYPQDNQSKVTMSQARGTMGYIAPEVFNRGFGQVSHKSDVYSYGMMVLEVIGSRRRENDGDQTSNSDMYFPRLIYKQMDSGEDVDDIVSDEDKEVKRNLILVSLWCIQTVPSSRPSMSRVVQMLEGQIDTTEIPPMPTLSLPPRLNLYPSASCSDSFTISSQGYNNNNNNITPMP